MSDTTPTDEKPREETVQQMHEQAGLDEAMIEQLARGFARDPFSDPIAEYFADRTL